jgi:hypothetical protein
VIVETLLRRREQLLPSRARSFIPLSFVVPPGAESLRLRFSFAPAEVDRIRNLLTLSLFDPRGFRGAGHRHAPQQEIVIARHEATPGFLPGDLEAGEWLVEIDCHCVLPSERGGLEYALQVACTRRGATAGWDVEPPAPATAVPATFAPSPAGPPRWLKGELHMHSDHSDGRLPLLSLVHYAREHRLDFLALTDHNTTSPTPELARAVRAAGLDIVLIPGMELTTFHGHANALGVTAWIDWRVAGPQPGPVPARAGAGNDAGPATQPAAPGNPFAPHPGRTMEQAAAEVRRLGGTFVINHPRSMGYPQCTGCRWEFDDRSATYADAIEVWNGIWGPRRQNVDALELWTQWLNAGHRVPAVAGTDTHTAPRRPDLLPFTYVWAAPDPAAILAAVREGSTYLSIGPALVWRTPQPRQSYSPGDPLVMAVNGLHTPAELHLVHNGKTEAAWPVNGERTVSVTPPASAGGWYRGELYRRGSAELLAMTNPVFAPSPPA